MTKTFRAQIRAALANETLRAALEANAVRTRQAHLKAFPSRDQWQAMRQQARAVRAAVVGDLETHLARFVAQAQANGFIVHRAADARQAAEIVLTIARQHQAHLVAKSKSMVSEEIGLNHALEQAGIRVVETDLGEYIVQLRAEKPSHIIAPAVHLNRHQVAQTFHEKLGIPLTEDVEALTASARKLLRQDFLAADVGVSGVNFGVVESGTLCLVTNEGNGRMVTTLPDVHIALMGIERLVPTLDDLALMLALLTRSASGQKISVYVSLINGPRQPEDADGPRQRHLVLVDNGRSALRQSPLAEVLLCIRCGACLNACPVFREIGGHAYVSREGVSSVYPGPMGSIVSPGLFGQHAFGHLARASTLCGACREVCPVDIDLPRLLLRTRAGGRQLTARPREVPPLVAWGLRLYAWLAADRRRFTLAQRLLAGLGQLLPARAGGGDLTGGREGRAAAVEGWLRLPSFSGWGRDRLLPRPAHRTFRQRFRRSPPGAGVAGAGETQGLIRQAAPAEEPQAQDLPGTQPATDQAALVERFARELTALGGTFTLCEAPSLAGVIGQWLAERQVGAIMAWDSEYLPPRLLEGLSSRGIQIFKGSVGVDTSIPVVGLTGATAGIAETGTLVLPAGAGRPLVASLLPEVHVAVLWARDIEQDLQQVLARSEFRQASSVVLISGPSRTADIEMTLTIGVHGPREVYVFCVT